MSKTQNSLTKETIPSEDEKPLRMYDYSKPYANERVTHAENYLSEQKSKGRNLTPSILENLGNYILYGKDEDTNRSPVQDKKIQIEQRHASYCRQQPLAIDELMENIYFDERTLKPLNYIRYRSVRDAIDRETDADIPGMVELWQVIDYYQALLDNRRDGNPNPALRELNSYDEYKIRHMLIQLRTQQYTLKDSYKPQTRLLVLDTTDYTIPEIIEWDVEGSSYCVAPLGLRYSDDSKIFGDLYNQPNIPDYHCPYEKFTFDFTNKKHVASLLQNWWELYWYSKEQPDSLTANLLDTLYYYIGKSELSREYDHILRRKLYRISSQVINEELTTIFGTSFGDDWISRIWVHKIPEAIAKAATCHLEQFKIRGNPEKWKQCSTCGKHYPRTATYFTRRKQAADGFTGRCKSCAKKLREQKTK